MSEDDERMQDDEVDSIVDEILNEGDQRKRSEALEDDPAAMAAKLIELEDKMSELEDKLNKAEDETDVLRKALFGFVAAVVANDELPKETVQFEQNKEDMRHLKELMNW